MIQTLKKLLLSKTKPAQLAIAMVGGTLGLAILMIGLQLFIDVRAVMDSKDMLGGDYLVINKKISLLNTLGGKAGSFDADEIADIQKVKGIRAVGKFTRGRYRASMDLSTKIGDLETPGLRTDLFFESIPTDFIDVPADEWGWKKGDAEVPIIIPSDFFKLYNMAFAESQSLPIIPENLIKTVGFNLLVKGNGKEVTLRGRIAGFSQRINTILVPESFMQYANQEYGSGQEEKPTRLVIHADDPSSPALSAFFTEKGYDLNEEKLKASRYNTLLNVIMLFVTVIGVILVIMALLGFMQYNQLLAYRSAYEIQTLHWLGFRLSEIGKPYKQFSTRTILYTYGFATLLALLERYWVEKVLSEKGFETELPGVGIALPAGALVALLMIVMSWWSSKKQIATIAG